MEGAPPPDPSIPELVGKLIDDGEDFVRAEFKLYRARLFSRLDEVRSAIILIVVALSLVQAVIVAALVDTMILLQPLIGSAWATVAVVVIGLALAGLAGWLAMALLRKATEIKDKP